MILKSTIKNQRKMKFWPELEDYDVKIVLGVNHFLMGRIEPQGDWGGGLRFIKKLSFFIKKNLNINRHLKNAVFVILFYLLDFYFSTTNKNN